MYGSIIQLLLRTPLLKINGSATTIILCNIAFCAGPAIVLWAVMDIKNEKNISHELVFGLINPLAV